MVLGFKLKFPWDCPTHFVEKILACVDPYYEHENIPKIHTIRRGKRWIAGMEIHMATGVRTKSYCRFNDPYPKLHWCHSTQEIIIKNDPKSCEFEVSIDGREIFYDEICQLATNDGFDTLEDFKTYFKGGFEGQIVHWTDFKYSESAAVQQMVADFITNKNIPF